VAECDARVAPAEEAEAAFFRRRPALSDDPFPTGIFGVGLSSLASEALADDGPYGAAEGGSPPGSGLGRTGFPVAAGAALFSGLIV